MEFKPRKNVLLGGLDGRTGNPCGGAVGTVVKQLIAPVMEKMATMEEVRHPKVERNDACPCGRRDKDDLPVKFKNCCMNDPRMRGQHVSKLPVKQSMPSKKRMAREVARIAAELAAKAEAEDAAKQPAPDPDLSEDHSHDTQVPTGMRELREYPA